MKPKIPENLAVIALDHNQYYETNIKMIKRRLVEAGKGKTLFIEGSQRISEERLLKKEKELAIFSIAVLTARKLGWKIVFLDREIITSKLKNYSRHGPTPIDKYVRFTLREKDWVRRINQANAINGGLIIMHPNHVKGFVKEAEISPKKVEWINKPIRSVWQPPTPKKVIKLKRKRARSRFERRSK